MIALQENLPNVQKLKKIVTNAELIICLRNWDADYVERENERIKKTGEIFTPTALVQKMLNSTPKEQFELEDKTFLDPSCGNGQFLSEVLIKKLENGISFEKALKTIYGVDIMLDNVDVCRNRLLCGQEQFRYIVEKNIVCADALTFNFDSLTDWSN